MWEKTKSCLWWIFYAWIALVFAIFVLEELGILHNPDRASRPRLGDKCGPHHHWVEVGTPLNRDLSCEAD